MDTIDVVAQARDIAVRKRALEQRNWTLGEVLEVNNVIGIRDLLDEKFRPWPSLGRSDLGLTVLGRQHDTIYLDSDTIQHLLPHVRETGNLREAITSFDKLHNGPPMGRNFALQDADEIIGTIWGKTQEGARESLKRAVKRIQVRSLLEKMLPELTEHGLEIHAYAKDEKPSPSKQATHIIVEPAYTKMPEGKDKIRALLGSRQAKVEDVLLVYKNEKFEELEQEVRTLSDGAKQTNQKSHGR